MTSKEIEENILAQLLQGKDIDLLLKPYQDKQNDRKVLWRLRKKLESLQALAEIIKNK